MQWLQNIVKYIDPTVKFVNTEQYGDNWPIKQIRHALVWDKTNSMPTYYHDVH